MLNGVKSLGREVLCWETQTVRFQLYPYSCLFIDDFFSLDPRLLPRYRCKSFQGPGWVHHQCSQQRRCQECCGFRCCCWGEARIPTRTGMKDTLATEESSVNLIIAAAAATSTEILINQTSGRARQNGIKKRVEVYLMFTWSEMEQIWWFKTQWILLL